jgi:hypothetical protein
VPTAAIYSSVKTFPRKSIHTDISPLRFSSVEMTKGRVVMVRSRGLGVVKPQSSTPLRSGRDDKGELVFPGRVVAEQEQFFITLGGPKVAHVFLRGELFARVRVAHPGPVAAHDRVAEECDTHNILATVYQRPPVRRGPDGWDKLCTRKCT